MREKKAVSVCVFVYVCARSTSWALCSLYQKEAKTTRTERGGGKKRRQVERRKAESRGKEDREKKRKKGRKKSGGSGYQCATS
jgi:hypothetical protein